MAYQHPTFYKLPKVLVKTVASAATPERVSATHATFQKAVIFGKNDEQTNNTGTVNLGVSATNGEQPYTITAGATITIEAPQGQHYDLFDFFLDVATVDDGIVVFYS